MIILGLTGSIGMGKSTAAAMLRRLGVRTDDADAAVHRLTGPGGAALPAIEAAFPGVTGPGGLDRRKLGASIFGDPAALKRLEAILHPLVAAERDRFLKRAARERVGIVALDVPLLFETGLDRRCDLTLLVTAPPFVQRARVLKRPGMTVEKLRDIRARQMPDAEKQRRADIVIRTGLGRRPVLRQLRRALKLARARGGRHWPPGPEPRF
ncbi:dephospho-CoA kinase [Marivibrio halodurans]|uniref:Dephospho-CoA kinase n=1 Tax=Marivibrio halodurans TaxID=2039722 RepID=A0A8J7V3A4_9PROT|nr:dephospho-CoA kinase [Marivibrio halodurans]MBP5858165.1 dephospho-CoA kinase [Marivibrio halodurans]